MRLPGPGPGHRPIVIAMTPAVASHRHRGNDAFVGDGAAIGEPKLRSTRRVDGFLPIEDYATIGDGHTIAQVGRDGSIDWLCLPDLDSPSVCGALLDPGKGGSFALAPSEPFTATRRYLPQTNVLLTDLETEHGVVRVTEAFTMEPGRAAKWRELVRKVEVVSGEVPMRWRLNLRFDYGHSSVDPTRHGGALLWRHGRLQVALRSWSAGEAEVTHEDVHGSFVAVEGKSAMLVLVASEDSGLPIPDRDDVEHRLADTCRIWRRWMSHCRYDGPWKAAVERSLLALRLLARGSTGAIAAAGTTSLPETIGGKRNYDYRYAWVRDLSFTADAFLRVQMRAPAHDAATWLLDAVAKTLPRVDPVYTLDGEVVRSQKASSLEGYRASSPVHVGNAAGSQLQLGGFGDLMETIWMCVDAGDVLAPTVGAGLADAADLVCAIWANQDAGLWELGDYADYTTSKIGCWTALHRALALADCAQVPPRHLSRWQTERDRIHQFIETRLWSESKRSYTMKADSDLLDCGVLLAARRGYPNSQGPRMRSTIAAIGSELRAEGPLLYRYSGMSEEENAFLACSFWMIEALALTGRTDEAASAMDSMIALANDVGLYSEEMEPGSHAMRGNFPQALTHLALVSAASILHQS